MTTHPDSPNAPLPGDVTPSQRVQLRYALIMLEGAQNAARKAAGFLLAFDPGAHLEIDIAAPVVDALADAVAEARCLEDDIEALERKREKEAARVQLQDPAPPPR
jgi:hypothetical protein